MVKHAMQLTMRGTTFLNPGQTGLLGADQPIHATAKQVQSAFPDILDFPDIYDDGSIAY